VTEVGVLPSGYGDLLEQVKAEVRAARLRAARAASTELVGLYWRVGRLVLDRQAERGWGARVVARLAADLRAEFPDMRGFSERNIVYMRTLAAAYGEEITQQAVARLPWGHVTVLLDKLAGQPERDWYAAAAAEHGWSRSVLTHQISTGLYQRSGAAPSNFGDRLPAPESDLARELVRDPYVFDFLDLTERVAERELEDALVARLQAFLLELGHGFAFVGRQYRFTVAGDDFAIDLLFFNWWQSRFVVLELKTGQFSPDYIGQLGFYVAWVDDQLRRPGHASTVGVLLCAGRNEQVVRYSLAGAAAPLAVAGYTYDALPDEARAAVPSAAELTAALGPAGAADPQTRQAGAADDDGAIPPERQR